MPTVFEAPEINWAAIAPMLVVMAGGLIGIVVEAFVPRRLLDPRINYLALPLFQYSLTSLGRGRPLEIGR